MAGREDALVAQLERRPGEKENRWQQLLGGAASPARQSAEVEGTTGADGAAWEAEIAVVRAEVDALRDRLDAIARELDL